MPRSLRDTFRPLLETYFSNFMYFYRRMRHRMLVILALSLLVGLLDGFGLAMFIPLLEFAASDTQTATAEQMGNLGFLVGALEAAGLALTLPLVLFTMLGFFLLKGVMVFVASYNNVVYLQYFVRTLRERNIRALANYRYFDFVNADAGRIQNTLSGEVGRVSYAFNTYMDAVKLAILVLVYATLAFLANPQFALLVLVGSVLSNLVFNSLYRKTKELSAAFTRYSHGFQGLLIQQVAHFKYLKATGLIRGYASKLIRQVVLIEVANRKMGVLSAIMTGVREPLMMSVVVAVILVQTQVLGGSLALILLSILFFYRALASVLALQGKWNQFLAMSGSIKNLQAFTRDLEQAKEIRGAEPYTSLQSQLELESVTFSYNPDSPIVQNVSLTIQRNETLALVGESGSGKTTLMNILSGLLRPQEGSVRIDGRDLKQLDTASYQRRIGYITQEPVIFDDTIFNNVTFWDEKTPATIARFERALERANILAFIQEQPNRYETRLGNNGINLSGGQKQRISIARELYKDVEFLFMDEATSALDSETEQQIKANIDALKGHYTIVIIAHRLSTIRNADRVVVLNKGRMDQIGSYQDLVEQSVSFKKMVELQEV